MSMAYLYDIPFSRTIEMLICSVKPMCQRALVWGILSHENVLPLLGIYDETVSGQGDDLYFVTSYMEHGMLREWRKKVNLSGVKIRDCVSLISPLHGRY